MAQPYIGEIRIFASGFAPVGWHFCDGSLLSISANPVLFQLIGTTYGGDGQSTFGVPSLGGRVPIHQGTGSDGINYQIGQMMGVENVTVTTQQTPIHSHTLFGSSSPATGTNPKDLILGTGAVTAYAIEADVEVNLNTSTVTAAGGSQPHSNQQPFVAINYIISLTGIFPSQT
jgi:microcystin-dependent protein